jgi:hypothetical protein
MSLTLILILIPIHQYEYEKRERVREVNGTGRSWGLGRQHFSINSFKNGSQSGGSCGVK